MRIKNLLLLLITAILFIGCTQEPVPIPVPCDTCPLPPAGGVRYAGIRSSYYGFGDGSKGCDDESGKGNGQQKFPTPEEAATVMINIAKKFEGAIPSAVWIIGGVMTPQKGELAPCRLEFPEPDGGKTYDNIWFANEDKHTPYLEKFDEIGAKVFLQVEPGAAKMEDLIDLCLKKYGHHESVIGFGFDVEWYPATNAITNGAGEGDETPLSAKKLQELTNKVKTYNKDFKVMSKHWLREYVGGTGTKVKDVIYFSSSQGIGSGLEGQFADWADSFYPNEVGFQIGYNNCADYSWWNSYKDPIKDITEVIIGRMKEKNQVVNIYWTDFTIRWKEFDNLWVK